jgi:hypothetical protein
MNLERILAYISRTADQELLLHDEYLAAENRIYLIHDRDTTFTESRHSSAEIGPLASISSHSRFSSRRL